MKRIAIENVTPVVSGGRYASKAVVGEHVPVRGTVWREGHEAVAASVVWRGPEDTRPRTTRMVPAPPGSSGDPDESDVWEAIVVPDAQGEWTFRIDGWSDPWMTWRRTVEAKASAGSEPADLAADLEAGALLLDRVARRPDRADVRAELHAAAARLRDPVLLFRDRMELALSSPVHQVMVNHPVRELVTEGPTHRIWVDRPRALRGAWYEFFPRSTGGWDASGAPVHGTFLTAMEDLERIADMRFDVVYLPPIHPIGEINRKGGNNSLVADRGDPGSPWAIGSAAGGHDAVHPALGTLDEFDAFVERAKELGLEVALDLALQCAPDHPWVAEHPQWFTTRTDGSVAYAENPPKRYQDIYPLNFDQDPEGLYAEILRVVRHWVEHGVRIFRVDNPHTKPPNLWHRLIWQVKQEAPDVVFLAEAFTRPARFYGLSRLGFSQSYTYFTWRTTKDELTRFGRELVEHADECRPNLFVNTPDILHACLQRGGPAAFAQRAALAATLAPSWGVYSGYELLENEAVREGSEEYRDSEKYQLRPRDYHRALAEGRSLQPWITRLNQIRRAHPALGWLRTLRFHETDNEALIAYSKTDPGGDDVVLVVVTLDPHAVQEGNVRWDFAALGLDASDRITVMDGVGGEIFEWGRQSYVKLDPQRAVAHIGSVVRS